MVEKECNRLFVGCCFLFFFQAPAATTSRKKKSGANLNSRSVKNRQIYRSRLVEWLTLKNENKNDISQDWRHKKEKPFKSKL